MARGGAEKLTTKWTEPAQSGEAAAAIALLSMAIEDARRGVVGARLWWKECLEAQEFWCSVLDIDPALVRDRVLGGQTGKPGLRSHSGGYKRRGVQSEPADIDEAQLELES